jgi:predicted amidohydrolase YtcJ
VRNFDLKPGDPSDLCVLDAGWANLRSSIASIRVIHTLVDGQIVYSDSSANIS